MIKTGNYNAVVCRLSDVQKHPNADRLKTAKALGYSVIVGLDAQEGDLVVCFPEGGKLSREMGLANKLYRKHPDTGEPMGGYFGDNLRVKACRLRGQISEAFVTSVDSLSWIPKLPELGEGTEFCSINGHEVCSKYFTKATLRAMKQARKNYRKPWWVPKFLEKYHRDFVVNKKKFDPCPDFHEHFKTTKLRMYLGMIPDDHIIHWSSKWHGTSGRTGYVVYDTRSWWQKLLRVPASYHYVTGTRKTVKNPIGYGDSVDDGYYAGSNFRQKIHNQIKEAGLKKDEILYYEIVGYDNQTPIMPNHPLEWKTFKSEGFSKEEFQELIDQYGPVVKYHYGNKEGEFCFRVYRITQNGRDLSNFDMLERCEELGFIAVPQLSKTTTNMDSKELMFYAKGLSERQDADGQFREGVCLRIEDSDGKLVKVLKYKSSNFCILENIKKNDVNYVDMEEIS